MGLMRKAVAVLGFGDGGKFKKAAPDDHEGHESRRTVPLSAPQQDPELPSDFHVTLSSVDTTASPSAGLPPWAYRSSADGRFGTLLAASVRGFVTLDSPSGSSAGTAKGPSCTGGGHGEAQPSVGGASPSNQRLISLSGRQSAGTVPLASPGAVPGTATATPLARHVAKRALRKAGDSAPISLPSITSLTGSARVRDPGPTFEAEEQESRPARILQTYDSMPLPPPVQAPMASVIPRSPGGGGGGGALTPTSSRGHHGTVPTMRRSTTVEFTTGSSGAGSGSGAGEQEERYLSVGTGVYVAAAAGVAAASGGGSISAPWSDLDPCSRSGAGSSSTTTTFLNTTTSASASSSVANSTATTVTNISAQSNGSSACTTPPRLHGMGLGGVTGPHPTGRERFSRVYSIPARPEHARVMEESSTDGQQAYPPPPHPPSFPSPHSHPHPLHRRSGQGLHESGALSAEHPQEPVSSFQSRLQAAAGGVTSPFRSDDASAVYQSQQQQQNLPQFHTGASTATRGSVSNNRLHYYPSHLQPQSWAADQRRRISEVAMRPRPPPEAPLPKLMSAAATLAAAAGVAAAPPSPGAAVFAAAPGMPSPVPQSSPARAATPLAVSPMAAATPEADEHDLALSTRPEPLQVLSNPPSSETSRAARSETSPTGATSYLADPADGGRISPVASVTADLVPADVGATAEATTTLWQRLQQSPEPRVAISSPIPVPSAQEDDSGAVGTAVPSRRLAPPPPSASASPLPGQGHVAAAAAAAAAAAMSPVRALSPVALARVRAAEAAAAAARREGAEADAEAEPMEAEVVIEPEVETDADAAGTRSRKEEVGIPAVAGGEQQQRQKQQRQPTGGAVRPTAEWAAAVQPCPTTPPAAPRLGAYHPVAGPASAPFPSPGPGVSASTGTEPSPPAPLFSFTARTMPAPGLVHFSPAAPANMLRAPVAWGVTDYRVVRKLYAGYASSVYKATCLYSGTDVVLKAYNLAGLSSFLRNQVLRELDIHSRLRHPGVVHLMAAFREGDLLVLVQEYVRGGSLDRVRRKLGGRMTEFQALHLVLLPLLGVLAHLHGRGVVHRDIKPENLLFTEAWQLKVCDFGVSICLREERAVTRTGSREYMAPEVNVCPLKRGPEDNKDNPDLAYSSAVDVWSLGALLYELLVGFTPFPGGPPPRKDGARGTAATALAYPGGVSQGVRAFVRSCLELDPADRPTVQQLLQHPWICEALEQDANGQPPP